jgi:cytochrome c553
MLKGLKGAIEIFVKSPILLCMTFLLLLGSMLVGCGMAASSPKPVVQPGDPVAGEKLFKQTQELAGAPTCATCHVLAPGEPAVVGPNLSGIATVAGQRVEGQSAEVYLYTSITDPYAYVVQGYQSSIMVRNYADYLTEQQINDMVAFLMTLE